MLNDQDIFVIRLHSSEESLASHFPSGSNQGGIFKIKPPIRLEYLSDGNYRSTWDVQSIWMSAGIRDQGREVWQERARARLGPKSPREVEGHHQTHLVLPTGRGGREEL